MMRTATDYQKLEQARLLLHEAGVIYMLWTADDVREMVEDKLEQVGLSFSADEVLRLIHLTHMSCDDDVDLIWFAIEDAIHTLTLNNLGG